MGFHHRGDGPREGGGQGTVLGVLRLKWRDMVVVAAMRPGTRQCVGVPPSSPVFPPPPAAGATQGNEEGKHAEESEARPTAG